MCAMTLYELSEGSWWIGRLLHSLEMLVGKEKTAEEAANIMMQSAAQYICLAAALQPTSTVYQSHHLTLFDPSLLPSAAGIPSVL